MKYLNLMQVEKPSRYIDHELNAMHKDFEQARVRVCLAFPDVYEIGISHLGLKILYSIVNQMDAAMADRVYLPWLDALAQMHSAGIPLTALESKQPVSYFDLIGITLQSELTYTNVLELLSLSGIPLRSSERTDGSPLILAGGPCASNPLPLAPFIDAFLIGEGEEAIEEIVQVFLASKNQDKSPDNCSGRREAILSALSRIDGMYVPCVHDPSRQASPDFRIRIRKYADFHTNARLHQPQLLPWQLATHNRYMAEIMRGCTRGCRFCQAGYFYRPVRERPPEALVDDLLRETETFGWEEAGLLSLSSTDYSCIKPLLASLLSRMNLSKTHISLPSLRADAVDEHLITLLKGIGREGLTLAPEAGSQRLREVINKNLTEADILAGVTLAKELGWQRIKLYFMLGLPTETEADIQAVIDLINLIISQTGKRFQISITLSPFVPKPHTPFQWSDMLSGEELLRRALLVKHAFSRHKFIKIKYHTIETSLLEATLSRGDAAAANWLECAWQLGAKYDGWQESFRFDLWLQAEEETGYAWHAFKLDEALPWSFIDLGIEPAYLKAEYHKALAGVVTADCRQGCLNCGVCDRTVRMVLQNTVAGMTSPGAGSSQPKSLPAVPSGYSSSIDIRMKRSVPLPHIWHYRLDYSRFGDFRYIGHLDWTRMIYRLLARCPINIVYTQGFNPHPKVSFSPPLPVGVESRAEYLDLCTARQYSEAELETALMPLFAGDFPLREVRMLSPQQLGAQPVGEELHILPPSDYAAVISAKISQFRSAPSLPCAVERKNATKYYDLKRCITALHLTDNLLILRKELLSPNPYLLLSHIFELPVSELHTWHITRTALIYG